MEQNITYLKYGLLTVAACFSIALASCTGSRVIGCRQEKSIMSCFAGRLAGGDGDYSSSESVSADRITEAQEEIWALWQRAVTASDTAGLPDLLPLSDSSTGRWTLPKSLEPDAVMQYYWGSKGEEPESGYPMFLYLHGSGPKDREWANGYRFGNSFDDAPSVYFIPRIPNEGGWYRWWQKSKQYAWEKLLRHALASGRIDPDRIYFFGISEGGYGSQRLASFYADYLAGAGPMAGGEPLKNAPAENCSGIAFSLRTGAEDAGFYRNILTSYTASAFDSLQNVFPDLYTHDIELIPGAGHHIDYTRTSPWLAGYTRNPYPKYVCWENFEMDGRYRDGFYNIRVEERSNLDASSRTRYEMTIRGNWIDIRTDIVEYTATETDPLFGIEMKFDRMYTPARKGKFTVYLNDSLVNPSEDVKVTVNGRVAFEGRLEATIGNMVSSCALFSDPRRIYPYAVHIDIGVLQSAQSK